MRVFKFGGASVKDPEAVRNVTNILQNYKSDSIVIVISAMGKTTNGLERVVNAHANQTGKAVEYLDEIKAVHYQMIDELFEEPEPVKASINDIFVEADWVLEEEVHPDYDFMYDQLVSVGELVSSKIVSSYLNQVNLPAQWLDARDIIVTDNIYRQAGVQWEETVENAKNKAQPMLEKGGFVITQGFIGTTSENFTTTLGREGSDYTAAIFSYCLDAEDMTIWKDVPGVLTADPRKFDYVTKLDKLSYREAIEMTYYGAKVIHPKTIKPLQNKNISLYVKSFIDPKGTGTLISSAVEDNYPPMVAIEENQALLNISTKDFSFVAEHHMSYLFKKIAETRLQVQMMQNTAISFAICVTNVDGKVEKFTKSIAKDFNVDIDYGLELITVRHYQKDILDNLREGKIILLEERIRKTVQMVVKDVPVMKRKKKTN
ncbi:MAG: aspartate kinase [Bacteroidetes bacterium]|jgi:aspartate kinase|nr:aspartate kinase [Bacteroidota bacterium]MDF1864920.1 aspartate kinase [Saprospiraceae bacterium]